MTATSSAAWGSRPSTTYGSFMPLAMSVRTVTELRASPTLVWAVSTQLPSAASTPSSAASAVTSSLVRPSVDCTLTS